MVDHEDGYERDAQRIKDREHLKLLRIFNYVFAGLCGLGVLMSSAQLVFWRSGFFTERFEEARARHFAEGPDALSAPDTSQAFAQMQNFITIFLGVWIVIALLGAILSLLNGNYLHQRRNRTFSMVIAALQCLAIPLGTILGVFTFIVLGRGSVQKLYEERD